MQQKRKRFESKSNRKGSKGVPAKAMLTRNYSLSKLSFHTRIRNSSSEKERNLKWLRKAGVDNGLAYLESGSTKKQAGLSRTRKISDPFHNRKLPQVSYIEGLYFTLSPYL